MIDFLSSMTHSLRRAASRLVYERRYGVETTEAVDLDEFGLDAEGRRRYEPADWRALARVLPRRSVSPQDVFIDLGAGKGRIVIQAAVRYPFGRVIGVELADELTEISRRNVERNRARLTCKNVELVTADATQYQLPDDVSVVFMHNPFFGAVFESVVGNLTASWDRRPRHLRVIYKNALEHDALMATGRFRVAEERKGPAARLFGRPDREVTRTYEVVGRAP